MTDQFSKPNFARGVRLCVEHVYVTLADMKTQAENANIENQVDALAPCRIAWHCPWIGAESAQEGKPVAFWPFTIPPFQQDFVRDRLSDPGYPVVLRELSVAFDQRAEPGGVVSPNSTSEEALLTDPDMDRYDLTIRLFEKQPTATGGSASIVPREVLRLELNGENAYGNEFARLNPFTIDTLNVRLKPFMVYYWQVECPGLYSEDGDPLFGAPTVEQLAMPSFTLVATVLSPLTVRDQLDDFAFPGIQNIPAKHGGLKTGTTISLVTPVADTIITGTDVQTALGGFDEAARERMPSGYGTGHGATGNVMQAADRPPSELLEKDAYLSVIMVPMWHGQRNNSIRASDVPTMGMPFAPDPFVAPWLTPTMDRRVLRVPSNFVIHHVFAVWNNWSPRAPIVGHAAVGTESTAATYQQEVGVAIHSGFKGDDYRMQQVAFLR
ncbi:MAG: hypothetical protein FJ100_16265, partial [Deltaproteobacteria bacterium]|nr:hypothetical protein [Deltaproteobacteria bacterium]